MDSLLIADRYPIVRAGVRVLLQRAFAFSNIGEADTGADVLQALQLDIYSLVLLELQLPHTNGLDVLDHLVSRRPDVKVLVFSSLPEDIYAPHVLHAGARGFVSKQSGAEELVNAVRMLQSGQRYLGPGALDALTHEIGEQHGAKEGRLTQREFRVMRMIAAGQRSADIARTLRIAVETVRSDRRRLLQKMSLRNNSDLTAYAVRHELC